MGTIAHVYEGGIAYEVGFVAADGRTLAVETLTSDHVEPFAGSQILRGSCPAPELAWVVREDGRKRRAASGAPAPLLHSGASSERQFIPMHPNKPTNQQAEAGAAPNTHSNTMYEYETPTSSSITLEGTLPGGKRLMHPLSVLIEHDDGEVIASESTFHMHASGATEEAALDAFRQTLIAHLDVLADSEETLGPHLRNQLRYLRSAIR